MTVYYVIEFQTNDGTGAALVHTYTDRNQAEQQYYTIMASASASQIEKHGALLMTGDLNPLKYELAFRHQSEPEE